MVIDVNGNGSILFQSLDPTDNSLYTFSQNNTYVFVPVINLTIGNTANLGVINIYGNTVNVVANTLDLTASNTLSLNVGGSTMNIQVAKPPTYTILGPLQPNTASISGNYTPPAGVVWLHVRMVAGGGAGNDWDAAGTGLQSGNNTSFGNSSANVVCFGGSSGTNINGDQGGNVVSSGVWAGVNAIASSVGAFGNLVTQSSWGTIMAQPGAAGGSGATPSNANYMCGGMGGATLLGAGGAMGAQQAQNGFSAIPGSGGGGGGSGGQPSINPGGGGGAGGYAELWLTQFASSYAYTVGAGGFIAGWTGGVSSSGLGGPGGSGIIIIEEHYGF